MAHFADPAFFDDLKIKRTGRGAFQRMQQSVIVGIMLNMEDTALRDGIDDKIPRRIQLHRPVIIFNNQKWGGNCRRLRTASGTA